MLTEKAVCPTHTTHQHLKNVAIMLTLLVLRARDTSDREWVYYESNGPATRDSGGGWVQAAILSHVRRSYKSTLARTRHQPTQSSESICSPTGFANMLIGNAICSTHTTQQNLENAASMLTLLVLCARDTSGRGCVYYVSNEPKARNRGGWMHADILSSASDQ